MKGASGTNPVDGSRVEERTGKQSRKPWTLDLGVGSLGKVKIGGVSPEMKMLRTGGRVKPHFARWWLALQRASECVKAA